MALRLFFQVKQDLYYVYVVIARIMVSISMDLLYHCIMYKHLILRVPRSQPKQGVDFFVHFCTIHSMDHIKKNWSHVKFHYMSSVENITEVLTLRCNSYC